MTMMLGPSKAVLEDKLDELKAVEDAEAPSDGPVVVEPDAATLPEVTTEAAAPEASAEPEPDGVDATAEAEPTADEPDAVPSEAQTSDTAAE